MPLQIRVFTGSPAEGELQRGDVIIKINNIDVSSLNHKQAQDIIKTPAGQLVLNIQRGQTRFSPVKSVQPVQQPSQFHQPTPSGFRSVPFEGSNPAQKSSLPTGGMRPSTNFAVDYTGRVGSPTRRPEQTMINRVHDSLNEAIWAHQSGNDPEDDYNYGSVADRKKNFSQDTPETKYDIHVKPNVSQAHRYAVNTNVSAGQRFDQKHGKPTVSRNVRYDVDANVSQGHGQDEGCRKAHVSHDHHQDTYQPLHVKAIAHRYDEEHYVPDGQLFDNQYGPSTTLHEEPYDSQYGAPAAAHGQQYEPKHRYDVDPSSQGHHQGSRYDDYPATNDRYDQAGHEYRYEQEPTDRPYDQDPDRYEHVPVKNIAHRFDQGQGQGRDRYDQGQGHRYGQGHAKHNVSHEHRYDEGLVKSSGSHHYRFDDDQAHGPYEYHPVKDNVKFYQGPKNKYGAPVVHSPGRPSKTGKGWRPPPQLTKEKPVEFGWSPSKRIQPGYVPGPPTNERAYSPPRPAPAPARPRFVSTHHTSGDGSGPAWKGTLHGAGQDPAPPLQAPASRSVQFSPHKPSSLPHQKPNYHPGPPQQHHQPHVNQPQPQHDGPKVVHLQYNSPIGLYSKQNVDETYTGQTQALQQSGIGGGDGKDMDYTKSYAWQMIKQESGAAPGGGTSHSQSTTETAYHEKQSRSFKALEDSVGASDF
ncbi:uncharacterized protein LOC135483011 isoform X2 [Lineus longissimus]|uniref:uncharacterized protein LOC135483011 isoform X2 n=1 Tax=Lineus longissimus TaxID=88925 RepID=UPI00315DF377